MRIRHTPQLPVRCYTTAYLTIAFLAVLSMLTLAASQDALAQGCAMCQTLFPSENATLVQGMLRSAFFLMAMPFVVFGSIAGCIFYRYWKMNRSSRAEGAIVHSQVMSIPKEERP